MDIRIFNVLILFGITCFSPNAVRAIREKVSVRVSSNKEVHAGNDVSLECFGSTPTLSYYIKNKLHWSHTDINGVTKYLTDAFYFDLSVKDEFSTGHYLLDYETVAREFRYRLNISEIRHIDDGTYMCSLIGTTFENGITRHHTIDQKPVKVTVLNAVESLSLRMENVPGAMSTKPISREDKSVTVKTGQQKVRCRASGSNPAPVMGILYNEETIHAVPKYTFSVSRQQLKYTGEVEVLVNVNSSFGTEQTIVCFANVPNEQYPIKEAGLKLTVIIEKPDISCNNVTIEQNILPVHIELNCNITKPPGAAQLTCDKVFWILPEEQTIIPAKEGLYTLQETSTKSWETHCFSTEDGLMTNLLLNKNGVYTQRVYYIRYGMGENSHRIPIYIQGSESSAHIRCPSQLHVVSIATALLILTAFSN